MRVPFAVVEIIPETESVSPVSVSVSFEIMLRRLFMESSVNVAESLTATGDALVQLMVMVPVAIFESHPDPSSAR